MRVIGRRRFLAVVGTAIGGVVAAACGVRGDEAATSAPTTQPPATTAPTTASPSIVATTTTTAPTTTTSTTTTVVPSVATEIRVICKQAWGARPVAGEFSTHTIEHITVHHTAVKLGSNTLAPARARQHQGYHQSLGWPDLAYHYLIDANGNVYEGRPTDAIGDTATNYDPAGHLLICCEGDFDKQEITSDQYEALVTVLAWGVNRFGIDPADIRGHRDLATTSCPGDSLHSLIESGTVGGDVAARLAADPPNLGIICGDDAADLVAAIESGTA